MLHFVRRRLFFGCVLGFIALFAAGALAKGAEGESRIKTARKECRTIIAEGLDSENARVRVAAVRAVGEFLGETHKFDGDRPEEILKRALGDPSLQVAYAAARFLPDTDRGKKVIERYVQHLADEGDARSRLERIRLLELDEKLEYVKEKALSAEDTKVRAEAIRTLGVLGGAEAISTVMQTYSEKDPAIQVASRNALWRLDFSGKFVDIYDFANKQKAFVGYICARGLYDRIQVEKQIPRSPPVHRYFLSNTLLQLLKNKATNTRIYAARAIGDATWLRNLIEPLLDHLQAEKHIAAKVASAGGLLQHLSTKVAKVVEESGYKGVPRIAWDRASFKVLSAAYRLAKRRDDSVLTVGHFLLAIAQSENDTVETVLSKAGLKKKEVRMAGGLLLSGEMIPKRKEELLGSVKRRFDPQTMKTFEANTIAGRILTVRGAITNSVLLQRGLLKRLRQKRKPDLPTTVSSLWSALRETMKATNDGQIRGVNLWLIRQGEIEKGG